ncbi:MAG: glycine oxidase ThiO [Cyanobacteria bacterium P01_G01_bin.38]
MDQADVLIVGGGIIGLAIAIELRQQGATVKVVSRDFAAAASHAAAGMLAPRAERLSGPMLDLCLRSLALYPEWSRKLEELTGQGTGYWPCGILAPTVGAVLPDRAKCEESREDREDGGDREGVGSGLCLSGDAIRQYQPGLSEAVQAGYWFAEDAQVDNRLLVNALRIAAQEMGIELQDGVSVEAFLQENKQITGVLTSAGRQQAGHYVLAAGAWSSELLPVPITPRKGQMAAVRQPDNVIHPLRRVLFGDNIYIVPRRDGRIVLGATSEDVGFLPHNTPAGVTQLLSEAVRLYPAIANYPLQECWWGFRPASPDELPILGPSPCHNLTLATGHYRNGILLAPITAKLLAQAITNPQNSDLLLNSFSWKRFHLPTTQSSPSPPPSPSPHSPTTHPPMQLTSPPPHLPTSPPPTQDILTIAGRQFTSRLMTGSGKFDNFDVMRQSLAASGSQIVTVAVRRVHTNAPGHEGLAEALDWGKIWMLPNTAGCATADEAIRVARLGREMAKLLGQEDNNFVKLEVIPDAKYLLPDPIGTLQAAEQLIKEGFAVLPYINADPLLAKRLEEAGCATVMPLGSPIGSGQGVRNAANIRIIVENANVPVVVDAGIGTPSEAAESMELGADALLINTAIAKANDPVAMGRAMGLATEAGRLAYIAGRIPVKAYASASSPLTGMITADERKG